VSDLERFKGCVYTSHRSGSSSRAVAHYVIHRQGCKRVGKESGSFESLVARLGDRLTIKISVGSVRPCYSCKPEVKP